MKIVGKVLKKLFIGNDSEPVNITEVITTIVGNFKKSPQTTISGVVLILVGVILLVAKPELEYVGYALIGVGSTMCGVRDVWSKKNQPGKGKS